MKYINVLLFFLAGCANQPAYQWYQTDCKPAKIINWWFVPRDQPLPCKSETALACAKYCKDVCDVFTHFTEAELPFRVDWDRVSIKDHEEKHCAGYDH